MRRLLFSIVAASVLLGGCGQSDPEQSDSSDPGTGGVPEAGGTGGVFSGTGGALVLNSLGGSASTPNPGDGTPEICDGIDNDSNGMVDDVDEGHDGICDCLNIATIGHIGPWSDGGDIFASWLNQRSPLGAVALEDQVLTPELLQPFQVIVVLYVATTEARSLGDNVAPAHHPFTEAEVAAFRDWVANGGGVMTTIGYAGNEADEVVNVNLLLNAVGLGYSSTKLSLMGDIERWDPHPVTQGVSRIFTDDGAEPDGAMGTSLAWDANDRVALQVGQYESGRVVVWGDEWLTYDSEWADITDQQVELFWVNILKWLSPPEQCQVPIPEILY